VVGLLVGVYLKYFTYAVKVVPLLEEFFLVAIGIAFYEVLQLGQIGSE